MQCHSISVATLPGPLTRSNEISWRNHRRAKQRKDWIKEANTKVWLCRAICERTKWGICKNTVKSHGITTANRPHRTLRNILVHPNEKVKDDEKTQDLIYRITWKNCPSSYNGETGRKLGLRMKEHWKEVDSLTTGTQTRASRARESSITHKSAITDHAVEENHVIDWDSTEVVAREAQRQTRWIKEALWIRKNAWTGTQDPANSSTHVTRWFLDHVLRRIVNS